MYSTACITGLQAETARKKLLLAQGSVRVFWRGAQPTNNTWLYPKYRRLTMMVFGLVSILAMSNSSISPSSPASSYRWDMRAAMRYGCRFNLPYTRLPPPTYLRSQYLISRTSSWLTAWCRGAFSPLLHKRDNIGLAVRQTTVVQR